jgi:hypothetical protein
MDALRGSNGTYLSQLAASLVIGGRSDTSPQWLFFCTAIWIGNFAQEAALPYPIADALLATLRFVWRSCIANRRFLMVAPVRTVPALVAALDRQSGNAWLQIGEIARAAAEVSGQRIPEILARALERVGPFEIFSTDEAEA